jgi:EAL domain-containing protein (putative c-di-GMP-specific phosphodiesterase class I)
MQPDSKVVDILKNLKSLGITISIDDFGTEYSSLKRLKDMPIDRIKIAMSFIHGITESSKDEAITKTIITLARNLGVYTIADGVETRQQLDFLQKRLCDEIQGFFFYKPMPSWEIDAILKSQLVMAG